MDAVCGSRELAHYVVDKCTGEGSPVSNLQLQKIMYFLQAVFCSATGRLLFEEEFEAWPYGPVLADVYWEYASHGGGLIITRYSDLDADMLGKYKSFIDDGIKTLREKSPWDLVRTSHADGSPWSEVWEDRRGYKKKIPNSLICKRSC